MFKSIISSFFLIFIIYSIISTLLLSNKIKEKYINVCNKKFVKDYPFKDKQNLEHAEFPNKLFENVLSKKNFTISKSESMKSDIENWFNSLKKLKKNNSRLSVVKFTIIDDNIYEIFLHRNGRNHGKVIHISIDENKDEYILSQIKIIGVMSEYEMLYDNMNSYGTEPYLKYNKIEDMWIATKDERLTDEYVDLNEIYNSLNSWKSPSPSP